MGRNWSNTKVNPFWGVYFIEERGGYNSLFGTSFSGQRLNVLRQKVGGKRNRIIGHFWGTYQRKFTNQNNATTEGDGKKEWSRKGRKVRVSRNQLQSSPKGSHGCFLQVLGVGLRNWGGVPAGPERPEDTPNGSKDHILVGGGGSWFN